MALASSNPVTGPSKSKGHGGGPFADPVYTKLSRINGDINKMNKDQIREKLASLHLDIRYRIVLLCLSVLKGFVLYLYINKLCDLSRMLFTVLKVVHMVIYFFSLVAYFVVMCHLQELDLNM